MSKFKKGEKRVAPALSSGSLSDIVFMLLFFFMVTTQMRESENMVSIKMPQASEITKLERKDLTSFVLIGKPVLALQDEYGKSERIQLNGAIVKKIDDLGNQIVTERKALKEADKKQYRVAIKADENTHMEMIAQVKWQLRLVTALKIMYQTNRTTSE